jgi:hypothetical protein
MRRHLQDYSFKTMLRRGDGGPHQAVPPMGARAKAFSNTSPPRIPSAKVPLLRLSAIKSNYSTLRSQSSRVPAAASITPAHPHAATSRIVESTGMRDFQSHCNQLARLSAEASQSSRILGSLSESIEAVKAPRPRLPLLSSRRANGKANERQPLWSMAPSIPKLFASLVVNRGNIGLAATEERLKIEQAQSEGCDAAGRIGIEHWMEFCRETDAFSKLRVAPSDCIYAFKRSVEAAQSDESALARKVGLVMNLEAFCCCIVILAELAGALPDTSKHSAQDGALHAVWDCDKDTSKACSLLLLKLLSAAPGMAPPKAAALSLPTPAPDLPRAELPVNAIRQSFVAHPQPPSFPCLSASPRKFARRQRPSPALPPPLPRKSSFAFTEYPESSVTSSPSKSKPASFTSSAITSSPPIASRQHRAGRGREERFARSSSHHVVDVESGSEFLRWFQDKLTQIGSDGLAYPVRIVAVQVSCAHMPIPHRVKPLSAQSLWCTEAAR